MRIIWIGLMIGLLQHITFVTCGKKPKGAYADILEKLKAARRGNEDQAVENGSAEKSQSAGDDNTQSEGDNKPQSAGDDKSQPAGDDNAQSEGDDKSQSAGDDKSQPAGDDNAQSEGDDKPQSTEDDKSQPAGDDKAQSEGDDKSQSAGDDKSQPVGDDKAQSEGDDKSQSAGDDKSQSIGDDKPQSEGDDKSQSTGDDKSQSIGDDKPQSAEDEKAQSAGDDKSQSAGDNNSQSKPLTAPSNDAAETDGGANEILDEIGDSVNKDDIKHSSSDDESIGLIGAVNLHKNIMPPNLIKMLQKERANGAPSDLYNKPHFSYPTKYKDFGRRLNEIIKNRNNLAEDHFDKAVKVSPELMMAVAKLSKKIESLTPVEPDEYTAKAKALRSGDYWNSYWVEEIEPKQELRIQRNGPWKHSVSKPAGSSSNLEPVKVAVLPGSKLYDLVRILKRISPTLIYVINN